MNKRNKMKQKAKEPQVNCVAYLSTVGDMFTVDLREKKQLRYISEYALAHNIIIKKVLHRDLLGQANVNQHFEKMIHMIRQGKVQGIIAANMLAISLDVADAYLKVGKVRTAGGMMITVDEGRLGMFIKENGYGDKKYS